MNCMNMKQTLFDKGSFMVKNIFSKEMSLYLTHVLLRLYHSNNIEGKKNIDPVEGALATIRSDLYLDTFHEAIWPMAEELAGEKLIPTYAFSRLYCKGNVLSPHIDRPACEVSLTIQLGKSHDYVWPIYIGENRYDLEEGDAVMYLGCEEIHWREECQGPHGYYSGQLLLHFVRADGEYKSHAGKKRWPNEMPYIRNRFKQMQYKKFNNVDII